MQTVEYVPSVIVTQATASVQKSVEEDLQVEDPEDLEAARAAVFGD